LGLHREGWGGAAVTIGEKGRKRAQKSHGGNLARVTTSLSNWVIEQRLGKGQKKTLSIERGEGRGVGKPRGKGLIKRRKALL